METSPAARAKAATTQFATMALRPALEMKRKDMPLVCQGRYPMHTLVWTDKDGVSRCRRCHAPWTPGPKPSPKTTSRERMLRKQHRFDGSNLPELPQRTHNPACPHPAPFKDPMEAHKYAQECMATGVEQRKCDTCGEWVWETLFREESTR